MKNQSGKNISISGLSTASAFMEEGLIDEYWFLIQPIVLGNGRRLFENTSDRINLKLDEVEKFKSGVVVLHYRKP